MKVVSIVSSFRNNGNTEKVLRCIEAEIKNIAMNNNINIEIESIKLAHTDVQTCRGCRACFNMGEEMCPLKDELLNIRNRIQSADGLILGSPVYVEDINSIMKNWIDRMAFNCHRPSFAGKSAVVFTTSGAGSTNHSLNTLSNALHTWGVNIAAKGKFRTGEAIEVEQIKQKYKKEIEIIASRFVNSLTINKKPTVSFYSLIAFRIQRKYWLKASQKHDTVDYKYWESSGWLNSSCDYYIKLSINPVKRVFARFVGDILSLFFI